MTFIKLPNFTNQQMRMHCEKVGLRFYYNLGPSNTPRLVPRIIYKGVVMKLNGNQPNSFEEMQMRFNGAFNLIHPETDKLLATQFQGNFVFQ